MPADPNVKLHKDKDGLPRTDEWHYRSLIGQLNYLTQSTRPDIQFAVHQCARFSKDPKKSHEVAAKRIVRYLRRTKDQGIILKPNKKLGLECYVDADFAGSWDQDQALDPQACLYPNWLRNLLCKLPDHLAI